MSTDANNGGCRHTDTFDVEGVFEKCRKCLAVRTLKPRVSAWTPLKKVPRNVQAMIELELLREAHRLRGTLDLKRAV
jgi:hypothetical protein